jgi:hypothetical protein
VYLSPWMPIASFSPRGRARRHTDLPAARLLAGVLGLLVTALVAASSATAAPATPWTDAQLQGVLDATLTVRLAPDLAPLSAGERAAVGKLLAAGKLVQEVYELQLHRDAPRIAKQLAGDSKRGLLYRLFAGPIATTLQNQRQPFVAVEMAPPGGNVYPWDVQKAELDAYLSAHPDQAAELTDARTVVARATAASLRRTRAALAKHPALATLHPQLLRRLAAFTRAPDPHAFYAVPYAVEYADQTIGIYRLLFEAAEAVEHDDWEFARYLRNRARDLLSNDYESGDASWVTSTFRNLNAQIGAYETYNDGLYGTRAYYSLSVMIKRTAESATLAAALQGLQEIEDALPYEHHKRVRDSGPVGLYDVVADFGQSRSANTASILPNEAYLAARYGRTILLRTNILRDPVLFGEAKEAWRSAVAPQHLADLDINGSFYRTLWHEVGHYLGVAVTADGRSLDVALAPDGNLLEEMKADLVSLVAAKALRKKGYYDDQALRGVYASGILRVLLNNRPRRDQPYNAMELIQLNYFLEKGLLRFDPASSKLAIAYDRYHEVASALLKDVLQLQYEGNHAKADAFIVRYSSWDEALHGKLAAGLRASPVKRFRLMKYAALGE